MSDSVQVCCLPADCCPTSCDPCCPPSCDPCCPPSCPPGCPPSCDPCCPPSCDPCCPSSYVCCTSDGCCEVVCCPVKKCKSRELRASVLKADCDCVKKNGLQDECIRKECRGKPCCVTKPYPLCCPSTYYWRYANMTMGKRVTKREKIPKKGSCGIGENYGCNPCVKPVKNTGKTIRKTEPECPHKFPNCCDPLQNTEYTGSSSDPTSLSQYQSC